MMQFGRQHHVCFNAFYVAVRALKSRRRFSTATTTIIKPILYTYPMSQPGRSVEMLCKEAQIDHEVRIVDVFRGGNQTPDFLAVNPMGLIPVWKEGDFVLPEAAAILQYICETRGLSQWLPSNDLQSKAKVISWLHWAHANTRAGTRLFLHNTMQKERAPVLDAQLTQGIKQYTRAIQIINDQLTKTKFIAGDHISIADLFLVPEIDQLGPAALEIFDFTPYPHISRWNQDIKKLVMSYGAVFEPMATASRRRVEKNKAKSSSPQ